MKILIEKLQEFNYAQLDKFVKRIYKHKNNSVTDDKQFYNSIHENMIPIEEHLIQEFCEYFNLDKEEYDKIIKMKEGHDYKARKYDNKDELVDIANLAFLIWCISDN